MGSAGLPTGTVSLLFTDIVGSTTLWEDFPVEMRSAVARHDEILRDAIVSSGGHVFASGGDGVAAVFARADDAVGAAVMAHDEATAANGQLPDSSDYGDTEPVVEMGATARYVSGFGVVEFVAGGRLCEIQVISNADQRTPAVALATLVTLRV